MSVLVFYFSTQTQIPALFIVEDLSLCEVHVFSQQKIDNEDVELVSAQHFILVYVCSLYG